MRAAVAQAEQKRRGRRCSQAQMMGAVTPAAVFPRVESFVRAVWLFSMWNFLDLQLPVCVPGGSIPLCPGCPCSAAFTRRQQKRDQERADTDGFRTKTGVFLQDYLVQRVPVGWSVSTADTNILCVDKTSHKG